MINLDLKEVIEDTSADIRDKDNANIADVYIDDEMKEFDHDAENVDRYTQGLGEVIEDTDEITDIAFDIQGALLDPNYRGMDIVAVEQLNRRLEGLSKRHGFVIRRSIASTESFTHGDNRRVTEIALEGLIDTIKDIWEKIKEAFISLWEGIKKFWKTHLSTIEKLIKKLNKLGHAASLKKGKMTDDEPTTSPGQLQRSFPAPKDVTANLLSGFTERQLDMMIKSVKTVAEYVDWANALNKSVKDGKEIELRTINEVTFGDEDNPLVGGAYGSIKTESNDGEKIKVVFTWEKYRSEKQDSRKLIPSEPKELMQLLKDNIDLLEKTKDFNKNFEKLESSVKELTRGITNLVEDSLRASGGQGDDKANAQEEKIKSVKEAIDIQKTILQLLPNVNNRVIKLNIECAKGVIVFGKKSLKAIK